VRNRGRRNGAAGAGSDSLNPWHNVRVLHAGANALLGLTLAAALAVCASWLVHLPAFDLRGVSIEAAEGSELRYVSTSQLRSSALHRIRGNFFTVNLDAVRLGFESVPWVRKATVRRVWPDRLLVTLEEHRPLAFWGDGRLMNTFGELYTANLAEAEEEGPLPELAGPPGSERAVLDRFGELVRWVSPLGRYPVALSLSPRYAWSARLDDGTTLLLGREEGLPLEARVRRWAAVYPRVRARLDGQPEVVDLRYPNGFAVRSVGVLAAQGGAAHASAAGTGQRRR
jgi:cell division protein FtsQ